MSPTDALSTPVAAPAGKFYNDDDEGSVSSDDGSSSSSDSSGDEDDGDNDGIPKYARPPAVTASSAAAATPLEDDEEEDEEAVVKIRQKAFDLINKAGGPSEEDRSSKQWPQSPKKLHYPVPQHVQKQQQQQQQTAGEHSSAYQSPYQQSASGGGGQHANGTTTAAGPSAARQAEQLSVAGLFINCVSDLCKQSSKEIVRQGASILSSGYQSVSHYRDAPLQGSYDPIDTSQHGYGNGNNNNNNNTISTRGRYHD